MRVFHCKVHNITSMIKNSGETNYDWNLLNSLKREMGIPVEFESEGK